MNDLSEIEEDDLKAISNDMNSTNQRWRKMTKNELEKRYKKLVQ